MKKYRHFFKHIGIIPVVLFACAGLYSVLGGSFSLPQKKTPVSRWKTFTNSSYLYSLSYPDNFTVSKKSVGTIHIVPTGKKPDYLYVSVIAGNKNSDRTLRELLTMKIGETKIAASGEEYIRSNDVRLADRVAKVYKIEKAFLREYRCYIKEGKYTYVIGGYLSSNSAGIPSDLFERIINSFHIS